MFLCFLFDRPITTSIGRGSTPNGLKFINSINAKGHPISTFLFLTIFCFKKGRLRWDLCPMRSPNQLVNNSSSVTVFCLRTVSFYARDNVINRLGFGITILFGQGFGAYYKNGFVIRMPDCPCWLEVKYIRYSDYPTDRFRVVHPSFRFLKL